MKRPVKKECMSFKESNCIEKNICLCYWCVHNQGLQAERDYRDWLVKNAPIAEIIGNIYCIKSMPIETGIDQTVYDATKAIRDLLLKENK